MISTPSARQKVVEGLAALLTDLLHRREGLDLAAKDSPGTPCSSRMTSRVRRPGRCRLAAWLSRLADEVDVPQTGAEPEVHDEGASLAVDARLLAERRPLAREARSAPLPFGRVARGACRRGRVARSSARYSEGVRSCPRAKGAPQAAAETTRRAAWAASRPKPWGRRCTAYSRSSTSPMSRRISRSRLRTLSSRSSGE